MSFTVKNDYITGAKPVPTPQGAENVTTRFTLALTTADEAINTIGKIGILPAGCVPVGCRVSADDLDSGSAAFIAQVGIWDGSSGSLSSATADGGGVWGDTGAAVNTAFDRDLNRTLNNMAKVTSAAADRILGVKVTAAPTTPVAGNFTVELTYRCAP